MTDILQLSHSYISYWHKFYLFIIRKFIITIFSKAVYWVSESLAAGLSQKNISFAIRSILKQIFLLLLRFYKLQALATDI